MATMATVAAMAVVAEATTITVAVAAALVAGFNAGVSGHQGDTDDSQEQGDTESEGTIHPRYLHCRRTLGCRLSVELLPSRRHELGNRTPRTA